MRKQGGLVVNFNQCDQGFAGGQLVVKMRRIKVKGVPAEMLRKAASMGVVKINIDTDTQWAYWDGVRAFEAKNHDYLQGQIGNPEGDDKPNKKFYDPRNWVRKGEETLIARLQVAFEDLNAIDSL